MIVKTKWRTGSAVSPHQVASGWGPIKAEGQRSKETSQMMEEMEDSTADFAQIHAKSLNAKLPVTSTDNSPLDI